jgi:hypothetical protein
MVSFKRYMYFFNSGKQAYFEQSECYCNFKTLRGRQHSLQKLTQFSQGNNVETLLLLS